MNWFIVIQGQQQGPYSAEQITSLLQSGQAGPEDMIWKEGMTEWAPLRSVPDFSGVVASGSYTAPPPPPSPYGSAAVPPNQGIPGIAITSFILGLLSFVFSILTAIPAIICGHIALGKFKHTPGL